MITLYEFQWNWGGWRWFNLGGPCFKIGKRPTFLWLWNCFNRYAADGDHWWGIGVVQVGKRHLFYIGHDGMRLLFL